MSTTYDRSQKAKERARLDGMFLGIVQDREDPKGLKRVRVRVPKLGNMVTRWAFPKGLPQGFYWLPEIGETVIIEFERGSDKRPYWSFGPNVIDAKQNVVGFESTNTEHGRFQFLHPNGSGLVWDAKAGQESVFIKDSNDVSKLGVTSGRIGFFIKTENGIKFTVNSDEEHEIAGALDYSVGGNINMSTGASFALGISDIFEMTIGGDEIVSVRGASTKQAIDAIIFQVINEALADVAGVTIERTEAQNGRFNVEVKTVSSQVGQIEISSDVLSRSQINITVTGNATVDANSVTLRGNPIHQVPGEHGVLHGNTIDTFTGVPFELLPTNTTPFGPSTSVKVTK